MIESAAHTTDSRRRGGSSSALRSAIDTITPTSSAGTITTLPMIRSENAEPGSHDERVDDQDRTEPPHRPRLAIGLET